MLSMFLLLGAIDGQLVAQWTFNVLLSFGVAWLGIRARANQAREEARSRTLEKLEEQLENAGAEGKHLSEKFIEERLRAASHEVNNHVQGFIVGLEVLKAQAADAATGFKTLTERDHENELSVATQISQLKDWMRETFADKKDMRDIDEHVRALEQSVAVLRDRAEIE